MTTSGGGSRAKLGLKSQISPEESVNLQNVDFEDLSPFKQAILKDKKVAKRVQKAELNWESRNPSLSYSTAKGGQLLKVHNHLERKDMRATGGGDRGEIRSFSRRSCQTMRDRCYSIDLDAADRIGFKTVFMTLTYSATFPDKKEKIKRDLDTLTKRINRRFGKCFLIWKVEPQKRGAPHFHIVAMIQEKADDTIDVGKFRKWLARSWSEIVFEWNFSWEKLSGNCEVFDSPYWTDKPIFNAQVIQHYLHHANRDETAEIVDQNERERIHDYVLKYTQKRGEEDGYRWGERWGIKFRETYQKVVEFSDAQRLSRQQYVQLCHTLAEKLEEKGVVKNGNWLRSDRVGTKTMYMTKDEIFECMRKADVPLPEEYQEFERERGGEYAK
jgi:hypothetical protein